jgi:hypothetical protein
MTPNDKSAAKRPVTRAEIDREVVRLLIEYGPDGHCDGHEEITDYIVELLQTTALEPPP